MYSLSWEDIAEASPDADVIFIWYVPLAFDAIQMPITSTGTPITANHDMSSVLIPARETTNPTKARKTPDVRLGGSSSAFTEEILAIEYVVGPKIARV